MNINEIEKSVKDCVYLQDTMNTAVHPIWRGNNYNWKRAMLVEYVEAIDHLNWKWWKHQEPNYYQAFIEMVDVFHFALSNVMESPLNFESDLSKKISEIAEQEYVPENKQQAIVAIEHAIKCIYADNDSLDLIELTLEPILISHLFLGYTVSDFFKAYIGKNVLNLFRQANGYKNGSYQKQWGNYEDNVFLEQILNETEVVDKDVIFNKLQEQYNHITVGSMQ